VGSKELCVSDNIQNILPIILILAPLVLSFPFRHPVAKMSSNKPPELRITSFKLKIPEEGIGVGIGVDKAADL
jgi:hypothetical protein